MGAVDLYQGSLRIQANVGQNPKNQARVLKI